MQLRRLLILDDEIEVANTICMLATKAGYDTQHTKIPKIFLEKVQSWAPTHVMVDLKLADTNGIVVIQQLAKLGCNVAVIIISGVRGQMLETAARVTTENGLHLAGVLAKPFAKASLHTMLLTAQARVTEHYQPTFLPPECTAAKKVTDALKAKAFIAHFQPQISCIDNDLVGFACSARWLQKNGDTIPSEQFMSIAEQSNLVNQVTRQACQYALSNIPTKVRLGNLKLTLNITSMMLSDQTFSGWLADQCRLNNVAAAQITLQVTDVSSIDFSPALYDNLALFRSRGFHLSINAFGFDYSSLQQLPLSEIKIDQVFVKNLAHTNKSQQVVTALIDTAKSLGVNVIADGVVDAWSLNFLKRAGCDAAYGEWIAGHMDSCNANLWENLVSEHAQ